MLLGANVARLVSGFLFDVVKSNVQNPAEHYQIFFGVVVLCTIPGMLTLPFIPLNREDIKKAQIEID